MVKSGLRSVMDITQDSGSWDGGSIPSGDIPFLSINKKNHFLILNANHAF